MFVYADIHVHASNKWRVHDVEKNINIRNCVYGKRSMNYKLFKIRESCRH